MKHLKYSLAVLILIISSSVFAGPPSYTLPSGEWRMISLPLTPPADEDTILAIFGDDLGVEGYNVTWVLFEFNTAIDSYGDYLDKDTPLEPGKGYWIIQITGNDKTLDMPINSYYTKPNPYSIKLEPTKEDNKYQWNLVGIPFNTNTKFSDLALTPGVYKKLWRYTYAGGNGHYEILEGEDQLEPWDAFWTATKDTENSKITVSTFGTEGPHKDKTIVTWTSNDENAVLYRREGLQNRPVVFFAPGYGTTDCKKYSTLLNFITGHGYTVICNEKGNNVPEPGKTSPLEVKKNTANIIRHFKEMVEQPEIRPYINLSNIGVMGFSSGGGHAFKVLKEFSDPDTNNWGENGRFLFLMEQWFAFDMTEDDMKGLKDTNVVFVQFGEDGYNNWGGKGAQDARILLTEYDLLDEEKLGNKDYQIVPNGDHGYLYGDRPSSEMQGILRPLDALMEYTFEAKTEKARKAALEVGTDTPYEDGYQKLCPNQDKTYYNWRCTDNWGQLFSHCGDYEATPNCEN